VIFVKAERDDGGVFFFFTKKKTRRRVRPRRKFFSRDGARLPTPRVSG